MAIKQFDAKCNVTCNDVFKLMMIIMILAIGGRIWDVGGCYDSAYNSTCWCQLYWFDIIVLKWGNANHNDTR